MQALTAGWGQWVAAYERCRGEAARGGAGGKCPNCGGAELRLVFSGRPEQAGYAEQDGYAARAGYTAHTGQPGGRPERRTGYAAFWCDGCLVGIHLSRCEVPDGVPMESLDTPVEQRAVRVPNYTLLWPDEDTF